MTLNLAKNKIRQKRHDLCERKYNRECVNMKEK